MTELIHLLLSILLIGLFLFSKLTPYSDRLNPKYKSIYSFFETLFNPILKALRSIIKPVIVGQNLSVDISQVVLFILLLILTQLL